MTSSQCKERYETFNTLLPECMNSIIFDAEGIQGTANLSSPTSKVAVVFGDNASGKSLVTLAMRAFLGPRDETGVEIFKVSMQTRTAAGMAGVFMYLDEEYSSTGASSLHVVTTAFHNARERENPVWLILDEPDIGLSDKYASAMGAYLAREINSLPDQVRGVVIISHSRPLLRRMRANLDEPPHEVSMGAAQSLDEYLNPSEPQEASIEELLEFGQRAGRTMKSVSQVLHG